jgi:hypothetical protein
MKTKVTKYEAAAFSSRRSIDVQLSANADPIDCPGHGAHAIGFGIQIRERARLIRMLPRASPRFPYFTIFMAVDFGLHGGGLRPSWRWTSAFMAVDFGDVHLGPPRRRRLVDRLSNTTGATCLADVSSRLPTKCKHPRGDQPAGLPTDRELARG